MTEDIKDIKDIKDLIDICLSVAKRRTRYGEVQLSPCWCEGTGTVCTNQPQCEKARQVIERVQAK